MVGGVSRETEFEQGDGGHVEACLPGAAVHEHGDADGGAAGFTHDVQAFEDAAAAGDDVFDDQDALAGAEREATAHDEGVVLLFRKDEARLALARDLLADDEAPHRGGEHGRVGQAGELGQQELGEALDGVHALAHLRALEEMAAVQAGAQDEVALEKGFRAFEDIENLLLDRVHGGTKWAEGREKLKIIFAPGAEARYGRPLVCDLETVPLEDELGDVLEKALCRAGLTAGEAAARAGLAVARINDALDWRSDLSCEELRRLAQVLSLNEVGLCALARGAYPRPAIEGLPFCLFPLRMPHGIGVANAYIVSECGSGRGVLFDTGANLTELQAVWPKSIRQIDAIFITHIEQEHTGGLCEIVQHLGVQAAFVPEGATTPCGCARPLADGGDWIGESVSVTALHTPGHAACHNAYLVRSRRTPQGVPVLVSGDLIFAGSVGGAHFCRHRLHESVQRVLRGVPDAAVIAPGHGPLTTVGHERRYNPFAL